ncbi:MAG: anhydro-N-acetylmuramic acid kinase [Alphaproteobacteria bacterium]
MNNTYTIAGTMSGTSLDGVDVAVLTTDGETHLTPGNTGFTPYSDAERAILQSAFDAGASMTDRRDRSGIIGEAEQIVTDVHIRALKEQIQKSENPVDHVGLHGQTIFHDPGRKLTIQIGDAQRIADELGLPIVHDLRQNDVMQGGEGAPLAPVFHAALIEALGAVKPAIFLNIGGVANVTFVGKAQEILAFDTGPGNALLDDLMQVHFGMRMDLDGAVAGRGCVKADIVNRLMSHSFFDRKPPKSLDRREFHEFALTALGDSAAEDRMATLTAFTADAIHRAQRWYPDAPRTIIVSGGGVKNPVMMKLLQALTPVKLQIASDLGWDDVFIEANAFAYLAARHLRQLPISFPGTTSVPEPMPGGEIAYPQGS